MLTWLARNAGITQTCHHSIQIPRCTPPQYEQNLRQSTRQYNHQRGWTRCCKSVAFAGSKQNTESSLPRAPRKMADYDRMYKVPAAGDGRPYFSYRTLEGYLGGRMQWSAVPHLTRTISQLCALHTSTDPLLTLVALLPLVALCCGPNARVNMGGQAEVSAHDQSNLLQT